MLPLQRFQDFIVQHGLFNQDNKILLAVSGGKDSVLMLHLFRAIGIHVGVAHCNFNLRGDEAIRDEHFVKLLADQLDLPFHITHFDTKKYAAENKVSTQMAARDLRYKWFEEIRVKHGYHYIALAQHQNDAIETVLINLVRGTGIGGLHGILPKRDQLIRPLLFLSRDEIDRVVLEQGFDFVEDSSNLTTDYTRNKLRLQVIPHLKEINPAIEKTFAANIERFAEIEAFLANQINQISARVLRREADGIYIALKDVAAFTPQRLVLFEVLKPYGFSSTVVDEILSSLESHSGLIFWSETHQLIIDRSDLIIVERQNEELLNQFFQPSSKAITFGRHIISLTHTNELRFSSNASRAYVDADKLIFPLVVRIWQMGDKFIPLGMKNFKKLSDYFIDTKVPLNIKHTQPILINGNGEIIWIAGMRQDNRYKLTSATKKVIIFELEIN